MMWIEFFRILARASGTESTRALATFSKALKYTDADCNRAAEKYKMEPLPGGRGDLGMSELAEWFKEATR